MHGLNFLSEQHNLARAFVAHYDYILVAISYIIGCLAIYTAWSMAALFKKENDPRKKNRWKISGGLVMGCGIWAMHFVGMLAYQLPIAVNYDLTITIISILPAIIACTAAINIMGKSNLDLIHFAVGSLTFGMGIGIMHYIGMAAMRLNATMVYDTTLFIISIVVAILLSFISLKLKYVTENFSSHQYYQSFKFASILTMGAAVACMHYTGMAAVYYFPATQIDLALTSTQYNSLPVMVIVIAILIMAVTIAITTFEQRIKNVMHSEHTSKERMFEAIDSISDGFVMFDAADKLVLYNDNFKKMYQEIGEWIKPGVSYTELVEKRSQYADEHINEHSQDYVNDRLRWHKNPEQHFTETLNDGRHVFGKEQRADSGDSVGIWTDISELKKAKNRLIQTNKQVQMLLDVSPSPTVVRSIDNSRVLYFNDSAKLYFAKNHFNMTVGNKETFVNSQHIEALKQQLLNDGNVTNVELELTSVDGNDYTVMLSATLISYDNIPSILLSFVDISEQKKLEKQLRELAQTDPLTGIYNRRYLTDAGTKEVARCQRNHLPLSVLMLDIDKFKYINDHYGHEVGDKAIIATTKICRNSIRDIDILGRLGGEEFAIILPDKDLDHAKLIAERIRSNLAQSEMNIDKLCFNFTASIGISTVLEKEPDSIQKMLSRADEKLYQAKNNGRNLVVW